MSPSWIFGFDDVVSMMTAFVGEMTKKIVWQVVEDAEIVQLDPLDGIVPKPVESIE